MNLLDSWHLSPAEVLLLLDMPDDTPLSLVARFRDDTPFPDDPRVLGRIEYLLRISDALRTYFPMNPEMRDIWIRRPNTKFRRRAPLAVMLEGGDTGLNSVLCHLDCTHAWDCTGSKVMYDS